jgi:hypothetical protein
MPAKDAGGRLPSPWREFLSELAAMLKGPLDLHCVGGFVLAYHYGLPRTTADIDYHAAIPPDWNLDEVAGEGSPLHKKYKIRLHRVAFLNMPEDYESRLVEMAPGEFKNLRLLVPDPYDCILSKLERNTTKDRDDTEYLFRSRRLDPQLLRERYTKELRPYLSRQEWHDRTLELWIEIFKAQPPAQHPNPDPGPRSSRS